MQSKLDEGERKNIEYFILVCLSQLTTFSS